MDYAETVVAVADRVHNYAHGIYVVYFFKGFSLHIHFAVYSVDGLYSSLYNRVAYDLFDTEKGLGWVHDLLESQSESGQPADIVNTLKNDFSSDEVFVFTPKGDVICLPLGATVIDFAYAIHSAVGNKMIGAKVDKRIVPLDYKVQNGEIVEVLTSSFIIGIIFERIIPP